MAEQQGSIHTALIIAFNYICVLRHCNENIRHKPTDQPHRRGFHELSGLHESQESEWRRRFHSSLVLCWRGHHNRWPAYYQRWHWLHSAESETRRDSRGCHRQWRDVDQQAPCHWWHNVILVEQGCQTSYTPFSTTHYLAPVWLIWQPAVMFSLGPCHC